MASEDSSDDDLEDIKHLDVVLDKEELSFCDSTSQYTVTSGIASTGISKVSNQLENVDKTLLLNSLADKKLQRLEQTLIDRLKECRQRLQELNYTCAPERTESFRYFTCGKPYFKDKSNFSPPDNEDTIIMKQSQMYDFSQVVSVSGWTVKDKTQFISEVHKMTQEIITNELQSKIGELRRQNKLKNDKDLDREIAALSEEICAIKNKSLSELALPIHKEYDWELLAYRLNRRHTAHEYESLWKLFFHPKINKKSWTRAEHMALQKIADKHNFQGWDDIAEELNRKRTGYQCFVYFRTNMTTGLIGKKWSNEEIEYLRRLVEYYREDHYIPWGKVAAAMENRTKIQIYNKYLRLIEIRKGRFLPEEDAVILSCVKKFGINFKEMLNFLPGRSIVQIRNRYAVLTKMRVSTVWTVKEDRTLVQLMANQDTNVNFSSLCEFFPGKDRTHIRTRYLTLSKWMKRHPNSDIRGAPRRGARRLVHGQPSETLQNAVENLKNRMLNEVNSKKSKKITHDSTERDIDDAIVTILLNECIKEEEEEEIDNFQTHVYDASAISRENANVTNLKKLLVLLSSNLDKEAFKESLYCNKYPSLLNSEEGRTIQIKSYSRKKSVQHYNIGALPDVWGNYSLGPVQYVLPPHYATITGCRVLSSLSSQSLANEYAHINVLMKRNLLLKQHFNMLMERFNILFLWPMLLSNEGPAVQIKGHLFFQQQKINLHKSKQKPIKTQESTKSGKRKHEDDSDEDFSCSDDNIMLDVSNNPGCSKDNISKKNCYT